MKTDRSRSEMLMQPGTMPQKRTDWKLLRSKTYPRFKLVTQEKKHPIGTMPMSTGIRDPRDGTRGACCAPRVQRATRTSRPKEGLRHRRHTTQTQQHRHRLELPCLAHASLVLKSNLPNGACSWTALSPTLTLKPLPAVPDLDPFPPEPPPQPWSLNFAFRGPAV